MANIRYRTSPNFTELEKAILTQIITANRQVIECKRNDAETVKKKTDAWRTIERVFNSQHGVARRSATQLRKAWQNMKTRMKKTTDELTNSGSPLTMKVEPLVDMSLVSLSGDNSDVETNGDGENEESDNGVIHFDTTEVTQDADVISLSGTRKRKKTIDWSTYPTDCGRMHLRLPMSNSISNATAMDYRADDNGNLSSSEYYAQMLEMHVDEHHTKMELLTFQLDATRKEHQIHMEILQKKKALYDLKFQQTMSKMMSANASNNVQYFQNLVNGQSASVHTNDQIEKVVDSNDDKSDDS
ncbi:hypothetical protein ScPMuIL_014864 [Solemya velum]